MTRMRVTEEMFQGTGEELEQKIVQAETRIWELLALGDEETDDLSWYQKDELNTLRYVREMLVHKKELMQQQ